MKALMILPAAIALALAPAAGAEEPVCTIKGWGHITDSRIPDCFPELNEDKCPYYIKVPPIVMKGGAEADVQSAKKYGVKVMNYSQSQSCEGRANCGFYVYEFASEATCDGKPVEHMPGGEYRGLTSATSINVQMFANRQAEQASKDGKVRGDKTKNPKAKGKFWGATQISP